MKNLRCFLLLLFLGLTTLPVSAESLTMVDHRGQVFELQSQRGKVVLVFFGYTRCPDICPIGLSVVARVVNYFVEQQVPVSGLFVSVDPDRDSPAALKKYLSYFSPHLIGLTGSEQQLSSFARHFGVSYRVARDDDNVLQVDHSANLYVLDQTGDIHTVIPFGLGEDHVKAVVRRIIGLPEQ